MIVQEDENDDNEKEKEKVDGEEKEKFLHPIEKTKSKLSEKPIMKIESNDKLMALNNLSNKNLMRSDSISSNKSLAQPLAALLEEKKIELYDEKIYVGIIYDIIEFFNNCNFNMTRLLPIDFSNLRNMIKNFHVHNVFKQLSREEKREYIHQLKEIKIK